jgi:starch-binding outer membrane protein, SusD/RagB family
MKNKILYLLCVIVVVTASCKKNFLEEMKSYDKYDESIFTNEVQTNWYIDRLYNYYFVSYRNPTQTLLGVYNDTRSRSTEEISSGTTPPDIINPNKTLQTAAQGDGYYGSVLPASGLKNEPYTRIRLANFLIEKIDGIGQALPEAYRKTAKGQMYFFRALQYFELARVYGGVPIVTAVQNASATDENVKAPRAASSEVFEQAAKDFDSAAALLPMRWPVETTNYGRFTAAGALAMKSRVLLTAASPLYNSDWDNPGNAKWQKALTASLEAETVVKAAGYGNAVNSAKDWAEMTWKNDNSFNGEALMVVLLSNTTTTSAGTNSNWESSLRPKDQGGTGNGLSAPKGMLDLFPLANGARPTSANGYVDTFFFENRDPRFYRTFAFSGAKWPVKGANKITWLYRWRPSATGAATYYANNQTSSPAIVRKGSNPNVDTLLLASSGTDIFEYRFGELLLNIAECYAATGNTGKCVEYLGKIRSRVGIPAANNYGLGSLADRYTALEACLYERRVELAYEGKRFWDVQRWMLYGDDASIGDNTNAKLGIPLINGTNRTGYYWQAKAFSNATTDPLSATERNSISIDPDAFGTAAFNAEIDKLKALYKSKFVMTPLDQAMDRDGTTPVNILFRPNYYIFGLNSSVLANNTWIEQTIGWQDANGGMGTFDYRK